MKIGIIGLPNSGKTTVFNALTRSTVLTGAYASPSGEHHLGQVAVPDPRLDVLNDIYRPKKKVPAVIEIVDVAGMTGSAREAGLADEMFKFIRDVDALIHVVRAFEDSSVPHAEESIDPKRDIAAVGTELIINDLMAVEKRLERLGKELTRLPRDKRGPLAVEKDLLERFKTHLEEEKPLRSLEITHEELKLVRGYAYLSLQPMMILVNVGESDIRQVDQVAARYSPGPEIPTLAFCGKVEAEISQLSAGDASLFMGDLGIAESGLAKVIRASYDLLGLESFFTVGKDEVRAWTIRRGDNAVTAAGKIHSDLARGFIRAEVVAYDDLAAAGSWDGAKKAGKFRLEGKDYVVRDGDVLAIRFNV